MSPPGACPDVEQLFVEVGEGQGPALEHARGCPACSGVIEEHRQLEKDLHRLADPLPPPDFVQRVMARVADEPAPVRTEVRVGLGILTLTLGATVASFIAFGGSVGGLGVRMAGLLLVLRELLTATHTALAALWETAAVPMIVALALVLFLALFGLGRLTHTQLPRAHV